MQEQKQNTKNTNSKRVFVSSLLFLHKTYKNETKREWKQENVSLTAAVQTTIYNKYG